MSSTVETGLEPASGLTVKQSRFVAEYLVDCNGKQAAIRAGYNENSAESQASFLLTNPKVQEALAKALKRKEIRTEITQDRVLMELGLLAFSDVSHYVVDDNGNVELADGAPATAMRAVSSIKRKVRVDKDGNVEREVELKLWDKPGPLKLAGRHVGLFPSKDASQVREEARAFVQEMLEEARRQQRAGKQPPAQPQGKIVDVGTDE